MCGTTCAGFDSSSVEFEIDEFQKLVAHPAISDVIFKFALLLYQEYLHVVYGLIALFSIIIQSVGELGNKDEHLEDKVEWPAPASADKYNVHFKGQR